VIQSAGGLEGLSARVLPGSHAHLGHMRPPRDDQWSLTIGGLLIADNPALRRLGLWFLLKMVPGSILGLYDGIVDDDEPVRTLCRKALCSIEPLYEDYMPRLTQRFRETDQNDSLLEYKMSISIFALAKAKMDLGEDRLETDPMSPSFFDEL
jgi:hypothetical protein